ncbi:MAG: gamma carbonic anhydrase family protein [Clostridiaceae bacterium]
MNSRDQITAPSSCFVAEGVRLSGQVSMEGHSSIWYNAVLRGDGPVSIGMYTNIQDLSMVHCDPNKELHIGNYVTIGHQAMIHNLQIGHNSLIGMGAILLDDVIVGENCIVGAGSLVTQGTIIPDGQVWFGSPAKYRRDITSKEVEANRISALHYSELAKEHQHEL